MKSAQFSYIFISHNLREDGTLAYAREALIGSSQQRFESYARGLLAKLAPGSLVRPAVGVWLDGAEPSACLEVVAAASIEDVQYIASLIGVHFQQKDALTFFPGQGSDRLYSFTTTRSLDELDELIRELEIEHRTYVLLGESGIGVYIYDNGFDPGLSVRMTQLRELYAFDTTTQQGTGDFVTSFAESRDQGIAAFQRLVDEYERRYPARRYRGHDSGQDQ